MRTTPRRRITLQCSQIGLTLALTFIGRFSPVQCIAGKYNLFPVRTQGDVRPLPDLDPGRIAGQHPRALAGQGNCVLVVRGNGTISRCQSPPVGERADFVAAH